VTRDKRDLLLCWLVIGVFFIGATVGLVFMTKKPARRALPPISNHSSYAQVKAHFDGKPYASGAYLPGFKKCSAWSNGRNGKHVIQKHGWVLVGCSK
jgi:hypothetical protein